MAASRPGQHLRDHELARWLGVSRTPVREALQRLERTGLVEVAPNRYTRVSIPDDKLIDDTHEFAVLFMGNIVRVAVMRCTDDVLAQALSQIDVIIAASLADDHPGVVDASADLFETMTYATRNRAFITLMNEAEIAIRRNLLGWHPLIECPVARTERYVEFRDAWPPATAMPLSGRSAPSTAWSEARSASERVPAGFRRRDRSLR